jgi:hypothetical protein
VGSVGPPATVPVEGGEWGAKAFLARKRRGARLLPLGGLIGWTIDDDDRLANDINDLHMVQCDGVSDNASHNASHTC